MTVSVVMTVYNGEQYVEAMLRSLLFQIRKPDEIVCVDDGSTDGSLSVLKRCAKEFRCVKVHSIQNGGSAAARIYGFAHSTGEAVCFVDCDDAVDPDYISSLHDALVEHEADVAVGGYVRETQDGKMLSMEMMEKRADMEVSDEQAAWINTALWNKMIRRECIPDITLPRIRQGDDLAYWCRILPKVKRITFVPKPMYHYIQRSGSLMTSFQEESFLLMADEFISSAKAAEGTPAFDTVIAAFFISLCVSQLPRWYALDQKRAKQESAVLAARMDENLPGWRKIQAFTLGTAWRTRMKGIALYGCGKLFLHGKFSVFEAFMCFLREKLHWKAKW